MGIASVGHLRTGTHASDAEWPTFLTFIEYVAL